MSNIDTKAKEILDSATSKLLNMENYKDLLGFAMDLDYQVGQLDYFYNKVVPNDTGEPSTTIYRPKVMPKEHQIAYFNLTRGFPKELYGGHWCYIVKVVKGKCIVIPTTSVKDEEHKADKEYQMDIELVGFNNNSLTRLQLSDLRAIDIQRIYSSKGCYNVKTERKKIITKLIEVVL